MKLKCLIPGRIGPICHLAQNKNINTLYNTCLTICIIGGGNSQKLPVSVKGVNSFTCPIINIETIGKKNNTKILLKLFSLQMS